MTVLVEGCCHAVTYICIKWREERPRSRGTPILSTAPCSSTLLPRFSACQAFRNSVFTKLVFSLQPHQKTSQLMTTLSLEVRAYIL